MKAPARWLAMVLVGCGAREEAAPEPDVEPVPADATAFARHVAERVARELDCETSPDRHLCAFALLPGDGFELPDAPSTWLGLHFAVRRSRSLEGGVAETGRVARLTLSREGAWLVRLDQTPTRATFGLGRIRAHTRGAASGDLEHIEIPYELEEELAELPADPAFRTRRDDEGWWYAGPERVGRIWRVPAAGGRPSALVVVEPVQRGEAGAFVAVFPDVLWVTAEPGEEATP